MTRLRVEAPSSKSMTQRALVLGALGSGRAVIERPLWCDDSRYLSELLEALGCAVRWNEGSAAIAPGALESRGAPIFCGNAGTAVRFGACLSLLCEGELVLDGDEHMRSRPVGPLAESLRALGVEVRWLGAAGCPPFALRRVREPAARVAVDTALSSQYASGLLLVAPRLAAGLTLELTGAMVSAPYLDMTVAMMRAAGAAVERSSPRTIRVEPGSYTADRIAVEPDWSAAAFLLVAARLAGRELEVPGLLPPGRSLQGDADFARMLQELDAGARRFDLHDAPDLIAPLAVACLFAAHPTRIAGAAHARVKESDRVAVLARELAKVGAIVREHEDGLAIEPLVDPTGGAVLDPDDDHRMAMAFGLLSLRLPALEVRDRACVSKSFPDFWQTLERFREGADRL